ncbi:unnamed protein product [Effrenium voratum]|nr:unnamed protein product [Effrenium voratum]
MSSDELNSAGGLAVGWEMMAVCGGLAPLFEWRGLKHPKHLDFQQFLESLCVSPLVPQEVLEVARKAHGLPYPPHWSEEVDAASGALYFFHDLREESSWQHPLTDTFREVLQQVCSCSEEKLRLDRLAARIEEVLTEIQARAAADLQQWIGPLGEASEQYFYNSVTGCSTWEDPCERWRYDIHVRYDLLVGFLVSQERSAAREAVPDMTHTLTSLASSMSSVQSILANSLTNPSAHCADPDDPEASGARWARPRHRRSCLPLPPKATGAAPRRALFSMPPHQQQYASQVRESTGKRRHVLAVREEVGTGAKKATMVLASVLRGTGLGASRGCASERANDGAMEGKFEDMDSELGLLLAQDTHTCGPLKFAPRGWGAGLRRGLGEPAEGLPRRAEVPALLDAKRRLQSQQSDQPPQPQGVRAWRPHKTPPHRLSPKRTVHEWADAALALQLQLEANESEDDEPRPVSSHESPREVEAEAAETAEAAEAVEAVEAVEAAEAAEAETTEAEADDASLALALWLEEELLAPLESPQPEPPPGGHRAEARRRARARREAESQPELSQRIPPRSPLSGSDEEFYLRLWGLDTSDRRPPAPSRVPPRSPREPRELRDTRPTPAANACAGAGAAATFATERGGASRSEGAYAYLVPSVGDQAGRACVLCGVAGHTAVISFTPQGSDEETNREEQCTICCENFSQGERLRLLPCLHSRRRAAASAAMFRAPGLNSVLNAASAARQILARRNAFEEAVTQSHRALALRDLSSPWLWLLACRRAQKRLKQAASDKNSKDLQQALERWSELLRFNQVLASTRALRPKLLAGLLYSLTCSSYAKAVNSGMDNGMLKPGASGIPSQMLLQIKLQATEKKLVEDMVKKKMKYAQSVQRGLGGKGHLDLGDEDLLGLTEDMKSVWASHFGSAAVWRSTKYRVPVDSCLRIHTVQSAMADASADAGSIFDYKEAQVLALEAPEAAGSESDDVHTLVVDGNPVKVDKLGPLVINTDGSIARINNWHEMAEIEKQNTLRVLGRCGIWTFAFEFFHFEGSQGLDAMNKISSYCQNPGTRRRIFEAFYANFDQVDEAPPIGFCRPLAARRNKWISLMYSMVSLMDRIGWQDAQPAVSKVIKKMTEWSQKGAGRKQVSHVDEAFWRALVTREADTWKLAQFLPADRCMPKLLEVVGKAYSVTFREADSANVVSRLINGWHRSVQVFEVTDGPPSTVRQEGSRGLLGYVYLDLYRRTSLIGRPLVDLPGAMRLCPGHAYVGCNLEKPGLSQNKLLNPEELVSVSHELGHAVHILCHQGAPGDFDELPLDVLELPSTLAETIAIQPECMTQYAQHWESSSLPRGDLLRSCQRDAHFFIRVLQTASVSLGLHSQDFDPFGATAAEVRKRSVSMWQRYSAIPADPSFTPLGPDAGINVGNGANHVAYLLCYLRVASMLQSKSRSPGRDKWLQPDFARRLRAQLLDQRFPADRMAVIFPTLAQSEGESKPHPLPPWGPSTWSALSE